jgi:hypothetical protein
MKYSVRYDYFDLGEQEAAATVVLHHDGSPANVLLVDRENFSRYRAGKSIAFRGGLTRDSPVRLEIPRDDHWYVVVDLGDNPGRLVAAVELLNADGSPQDMKVETIAVESKQHVRQGRRSGPTRGERESPALRKKPTGFP